MPEAKGVHELVLNGASVIASIAQTQVLSSSVQAPDLRVAAATIDHSDPISVASAPRPNVQATPFRVHLQAKRDSSTLRKA